MMCKDVVRRYKDTHTDFDAFPDKVAFQLNDTHPTIAVAELMRVLMDENQQGWTKSWEITTKVRRLHQLPCCMRLLPVCELLHTPYVTGHSQPGLL